MESWGNVRRPNFFLVGAPKCGTTAMHAYLSTHPDIFMAVKELHYFGEELRWLTERQYRNLFRRAKSEKIVGDASVMTLASPSAPYEIRAFAPNAKILVMLRDPREVVEALHAELVFQGKEPLADLASALAAEPARRASTPEGQTAEWLYTEQVDFGRLVPRWRSIFGASNVLVIQHRDFAEDNIRELRKVLEWLGVDPEFAPPVRIRNARKQVAIPWLYGWLMHHPDWQRYLIRTLLPDEWRRRAWKLLVRASSKSRH